MRIRRAGQPERRLTGPAWWFVAGYGLSAVGTGLFLPAVIPIISRLSATDEIKVRTMSLRYMLLNIGLGLGAGLGGFLLDSATGGTYRWLFAANGVSCALYAVLIVALVPVPGDPDRPAGERARPVRFRLGLNYALLLVAQFLLVTFGLAQLESGVPLAVRDELGGSTALVGVLYTVATLVVLAGQMPVSLPLPAEWATPAQAPWGGGEGGAVGSLTGDWAVGPGVRWNIRTGQADRVEGFVGQGVPDMYGRVFGTTPRPELRAVVWINGTVEPIPQPAGERTYATYVSRDGRHLSGQSGAGDWIEWACGDR